MDKNKKKLIVGLGNPGNKYKRTRHNIGFRVIDELQKKEHFPNFKLDKKFNGLISKKNQTNLLKPQTYMNKSGLSVAKFCHYYNIDTENVIVIHDDADFKLGKVKIDKNRSSGGHKGVQSIIDHLSTKNFWRVRFGIGLEDTKAGDIALEKFTSKERDLVSKLIQKTNKEIESGLRDGFKKKSFQEKN